MKRPALKRGLSALLFIEAGGMVTIGVDAHKRVHQAVALDPAGRELGSWRGANTPEHWQQLRCWATTWPGPRQWGVEGAWT